MSVLSKSLGRDRDWPQLEGQTFASLSGGTGNDPAQDSIIFGMPALHLGFLPTALGQGIYSDLPKNRQVLRQMMLMSQGSSNTVGNATNNADIRVNAYRNGTLQGCLGYYPLSINTTMGTIIQQPYQTTSTTAVTGGSTTSITVASATNIINGSPMLLQGTGTDSAKSDYVTVSNVSGTTITLSAAPVNSYSQTITVSSPNVNTTSQTAITVGSVAVTPTSMGGIVANMVLLITGGGGQAEYVKVASVTSTTFTATFAYAHSGVTYISSTNQTVGQLTGLTGQPAPVLPVIPAAMTGIVPGLALGIGSGSTFEVVYVTSLNGTNAFLSNFVYSHATSEAVTSILVPNQPIAMVPANGCNTASNTLLTNASTTFIPASIYGLHVGDYVQVSGGGTYETGLAATTVSGTSLTATFAQPHAGTYNIGYVVATTSSTAVTGGTTTAITVASAANIAAGDTLVLQGTGADSAKTNTMTVQSVVSTTVTFTAAIPTNSYSATINVTNLAYTSGTTTTVANKASQVITVASTTGMSVGGLVWLQGLTGNSSTAAFTGTGQACVVQALVTNTSITISPTAAFTNAYAVVPYTATTSTTAVTAAGSATVTLASGTNFATGLSSLTVWGGTGGVTEIAKITAVTNTTATATFALTHSGAYTIQSSALFDPATSATAQVAGSNTLYNNTPFELQGGDVVTVNRLSNNATGVATPLLLVQCELVPSISKA